MNNEIFKLMGTIGLDTSDADKSIDNTTKNAKTSTDKIGQYFKVAATVIGSVFTVGKLIDFTVASVEAAAAAQAIESQFTQVFGDAKDTANESLNAMADTFGMLPNRLKGAFTTTASMFKGLGLDTEDAMKQAEIAVTLAADAAAFFDKSYEDANSALNSFIKGNYEGGESIGLFANETQLATWASQNLGVEWKSLGEADKQMARLQFATAMQEAAGATGQAARESDTYQNQLGNMKQAWEDFKVLVGAPIMGVAIDGLKNVTTWLQDAGTKVQALTTWVKENETAMALIGIALGTVTALVVAYQLSIHGLTLAKTIWAGVTTTATIATQGLGVAMQFLTGPIGLAILAIGAIIAIGVLLYKNWDTIKTKAVELWENVKAKFEAIGESIKKPVEGAMNFVKSMIDKIKSFFDFKWSLPHLKMPHVTISGSFSLVPPSVPSFGIDWYKDGGIMTGPTMFGLNGMRAMVGGEAGDEAILPLNRDTLGMIGDGIALSSGIGDSNKLDELVNASWEMISLLSQILGVSDKQLVLDTGVLVGELTPKIDKLMAKQVLLKKRGG